MGLDTAAYLRMEEAGRWRGNERQTAALAELLGLALPEFVTATGRDEELAELLRSAVTTRWQAYVRPAAKLLGMDKRRLGGVLEHLHTGYQARMASTLSWGGGADGTGDTGEAGREFLAGILEHFWALAR